MDLKLSVFINKINEMSFRSADLERIKVIQEIGFGTSLIFYFNWMEGSAVVPGLTPSQLYWVK